VKVRFGMENAYSILSLEKTLDIQKNISIIRFNGSRNVTVIFLEVKEQGSRAAISKNLGSGFFHLEKVEGKTIDLFTNNSYLGQPFYFKGFYIQICTDSADGGLR